MKGGGTQFWADGVEGTSILESKMTVNAPRSPYIEGTKVPEFLRNKMVAEVDNEFRRMSLILKDSSNPLKSVDVILSSEKTRPFFEALMKKYDIPGNLIVRPQ